jgi:serine/threonine-protein kinase
LLADATQLGTPIAPGVILRILLDLLEPLAAIHSSAAPPSNETGTPVPALHGDITPHAIWVTERGRTLLMPTCVGAAVANLASDDIAARLAFKAPEQLQPSGGRADSRADQFAFGAVLWSALAGHRLFVGADSVALVRAVLSSAVPSLADAGAAVPAGVSDVVARALTRDPETRFRDVHELALALRAASADVLSDLAGVANAVSDFGAERLAQKRERIRGLFGAEASTDDLPVPSLEAPNTLASPRAPVSPVAPARSFSPMPGYLRSVTPLSTPVVNGDFRERVPPPVEVIPIRRIVAPAPAPEPPRGPEFTAQDAMLDSADFADARTASSTEPVSSSDIVAASEEPAIDSKDFVEREAAIDSTDFVDRREIVETPVGGTPIAHTPRTGQPVAEIALAFDPSGQEGPLPRVGRVRSGARGAAESRSAPAYDDAERLARDLPTLPPARARAAQRPKPARSASSLVGWAVAALMLAVAIAFFVRKQSDEVPTADEPIMTAQPPPPDPAAEPDPLGEREDPIAPPAAAPEPTTEPALTASAASTTVPPATLPARPKPVTGVAPTAAAKPASTAPKPAVKPKPAPKPADDRMLDGI